ncbi:MAG: hypothetical protein JWO09_910 [Bacteroidetes bacterium]|nr:hypothetical protein [Bacteroidota bacterium]
MAPARVRNNPLLRAINKVNFRSIFCSLLISRLLCKQAAPTELVLDFNEEMATYRPPRWGYKSSVKAMCL